MSNIHRSTPLIAVLDNRGLGIRDITYHRHPETPDITTELITQYTFNARGVCVSSADPRFSAAGLANFRYIVSLNKEMLLSDGIDNGTAINLTDAAGRPMLSITADGTMQRVQYELADLPGRPISITETLPGRPTRVTDRFIYASNKDADKALNLAGHLVRHYDTAGLVQTDSIALTGAKLSAVRYLLKEWDNPSTVPDWQGKDVSAWKDMLETVGYTTFTATDSTGASVISTDAKGNRQRVAYDIAGQLKETWLTFKDGTEQVIVKSLMYSAAGQKLCEVHGNGVVTTYCYEAETQRLTRIKTERPAGHSSGARVLQDLHYEYDPVGNVLSVTNNAEKIRFWRNQKVVPENRYMYDSLYQLVRATGREMANAAHQSNVFTKASLFDSASYTCYTRDYNYDRGGNLVQISHRAPATGNSHTTNITISDRSNRAVLSSLTEIPSDVDTLYTTGGLQTKLLSGQTLDWTSRGELRRVAPVVRDGSADDHETYVYDGNSQRILKISQQKNSSSKQTRSTIYLSGMELHSRVLGTTEIEGWQVITVGSADNAEVRVLVWTNGKPEDISNGQIRYSYGTLTGSVSLELDSEGKSISMEEYFPFGGTAVLITRSESEISHKTVRYSGKERDATGLYYYGYRYYQPWVGRWLSADPASTVDGMNLFRMCRNNPVSLRDNDGLKPILPSYAKSSKPPEIPLPDDSELHKNHVIPPIVDTRNDYTVRQEISAGNYETDTMRLLFTSPGGLDGTLRGARGFENDRSGWRKAEARAKNEIRVISQMRRYYTNENTLLFRGRDVTPYEYAEIMETGFLQNHANAFFTNRHEVAEYFTSKGKSSERISVIFRLHHNPANKDQYSYHYGRVDANSYREIYGSQLGKYTPGLEEIIALPGNVFRVTSEVSVEPEVKNSAKGFKGLVNRLMRSEKKKHSKYTYIDITPSAYIKREIVQKKYSRAI